MNNTIMNAENLGKLASIVSKYDVFAEFIDDYEQYSAAMEQNDMVAADFVNTACAMGFSATHESFDSLIARLAKRMPAEDAIKEYLTAQNTNNIKEEKKIIVKRAKQLSGTRWMCVCFHINKRGEVLRTELSNEHAKLMNDSDVSEAIKYDVQRRMCWARIAWESAQQHLDKNPELCYRVMAPEGLFWCDCERISNTDDTLVRHFYRQLDDADNLEKSIEMRDENLVPYCKGEYGSFSKEDVDTCRIEYNMYESNYGINKEEKKMSKNTKSKNDYTMGGTIEATNWTEFKAVCKEHGINCGTKTFKVLEEELKAAMTQQPPVAHDEVPVVDTPVTEQKQEKKDGFVLSKKHGDAIVRRIMLGGKDRNGRQHTAAAFKASKSKDSAVNGHLMVTMRKLYAIIADVYGLKQGDPGNDDFIKKGVINYLCKNGWLTFKRYDSGALSFFPTAKMVEYKFQ